jgi:HEAT repeat protein
MWRRSGDVAFATVFALAIAIEAVPLGYLTWTLLGRIGGERTDGPLVTILVGVVVSATLALVIVMAYVLAYQYASARLEAALAERRRTWVTRWLRVLDGSEPEPPGPLRREAIEALVGLREVLRGGQSDRVAGLLESYGAADAYKRAASAGRVPTRLEAIEALASARVPSTLPALVRAVSDPQPVVRVAAARAAARTLASVEDAAARELGAAALARALERGHLPVGIVEEVLVLAEMAAALIVSDLLLRDGVPPATLRAALDGVGRLQLLVFAEEVARFLTHPDAEVRAAALRTTGRLGFLAETSRSAVIAALEAEEDFIRIHAASAARLLPRAQALSLLAESLGDPSWWVRRAAADAMASLGKFGLAELGRVARQHPDRFARDIAEQALRERVPALVQAVAG